MLEAEAVLGGSRVATTALIVPDEDRIGAVVAPVAGFSGIRTRGRVVRMPANCRLFPLDRAWRL